MNRSLLAILLLPLFACAEDLKRADGTILKGNILREEPDGLVVETSAGVEKVDFLLLSDEVQKRFGFDIKKAREYRASKTASNQQIIAQTAAAIRAQSAALDEKISKLPTAEEADLHLRVEQASFFATAYISQGMTKGVRAQIEVMTGRAAPTLLDKDSRKVRSLGLAFIYGLEQATGDTWQGKLYPAGFYHYTALDGEEATMHAYATSADDAITHGAKGLDPVIPSVDPAAAAIQLPGHLRGGSALEQPASRSSRQGK